VTGGVEGVSQGTVSFTFTDANPTATTADFTATTNWGDATTSSATVTGPVAGKFTVTGNHQYAEEGHYNVTVSVTDDGGSSITLHGTATVSDAALAGVASTLHGGTEGVTPGSASLTFRDANPGATTADFTGTIDWGDGQTTTNATVSGPSGGPFTVSGTHQYAEEGTYLVKISAKDDGGSFIGTAGAVTVADAALTASCATPAVSPTAFNGTVATFIDANPGGTLSDFSAMINWGDASTTAGAVTGPSAGKFTVSGSHTYAATGFHTITVSIKDVGGSTASTGGCTVLTFTFAPGGGAFVIGDKNSANGTGVTFWGARWWKLNTLSDGAAPASFKGFAENPTTPSCGTGWSTDPGNSTPPPAGPLPAYMGVIVTSSTDKAGDKISGNTVQIVVVKTDPGYANDPGHPGTGTVVARVCP
jgi:hypothetical protein